MKELSLNILDIAQNSIDADSTKITITLYETEEELKVLIKDNGRGMDKDEVKKSISPFFTKRVTKNHGLGLPLFKMRAISTGGKFSINSTPGKGTSIRASFIKASPDYMPLGDIVSTIIAIISGSPDITLIFKHTMPENEVTIDTKELKEKLEALPLCTPEVLNWISDYLNVQYQGKDYLL